MIQLSEDHNKTSVVGPKVGRYFPLLASIETIVLGYAAQKTICQVLGHLTWFMSFESDGLPTITERI